MFQFQCPYTIEDLILLNRIANKRWLIAIFRVFFIFSAVIWLATTPSMFMDGNIFSGVFFVIVGLFFLAIGVFYYRVSAYLSKKTMIDGFQETEVTMEEDGFRERGTKGENYFLYGAVMALYHHQGRYFIFLDKKHAVILQEACFTKGDLAAFPSFMEEKTGKSIVEVK